MIRATIARFERKPSLGRLAHEQFVARLQLVQSRGECAIGHQFEEKLHFVFRGRRCDRIRTFDALPALLYPQRGVLPRKKVELYPRLDAELPEVGREIHTLGNPRLKELVVQNRHVKNSTALWQLEVRAKTENAG